MFFHDSQVSNHDVQLHNTKVNDPSMWSQQHWQQWSNGTFYPKAVVDDTSSHQLGQLIGDSTNKTITKELDNVTTQKKSLLDHLPEQGRDPEPYNVFNNRSYPAELINKSYDLQNSYPSNDSFLSNRDRLGSYIGI